MVLDSSAMVAIVRDEPEGGRLRASIASAPILIVGAPTVFETAMVLSRLFGEEGRRVVQELLDALEVEVVPFNSEHAAAAHEAFMKFGKGRHPAALNYGDCMAYAISRIAGHPLLFVGSDFAKTDISPA